MHICLDYVFFSSERLNQTMISPRNGTIKQMLLTLGKIFIDFSMRACNLWTTVATRVVTFGPLWGCLRLSTPEWFSLFRNLIDINYLLKKKQKKFILIK